MANPELTPQISAFLDKASEAEQEQLLGLLIARKIGPRGYIPDAAWLPVQQSFILPYVEVTIPRTQDHKVIRPQILLSYRDDAEWTGWHIPGGRWARTNLTMEEACQDVAQRELDLKRLGIYLKLSRIIHVYKWPDHPYGNPLSLVCLSTTSAELPESDELRYFDTPPHNIVNHHGEFMELTLSSLRAQG